ncbi:GNAT family N-acetyltransferase [Amycolatopsis sp. SID8362]|uniref:GNAT family N-acetyltransferase n=1 Tax=Amycolatopsis sp. SID8362 TaxID=2690346 RepID=UPI00136A2A60|nr:GNAT family N-acetyltransferase [Amycolatopsis sp. SID8362]NBH09292.1 GNAT family N-acetyltransferase [Amycolatopsis sp. SID8362]NED45985.1 GNAT family N-acetyltransferase [Amycolatopsis sp. SID8362]
MTVSVCAPGDVPALVASAAALFEEDGGRRDPFMDTGWPAREGEAYYASLVADPACLCLLAAGGHLIGRLRPPDPLRPGAVSAVLESMRVGPGHRRSGAGAALVEAFLGWARDHGANDVKVTAYAANHGALEFYRAQGFEPFEVVLRHRNEWLSTVDSAH